MDVLPVQFRALRYFGLWYEEPTTRRLAKLAHRGFVFLLIAQFTASQIINMASAQELDVATLADVMFLLFLYVADLIKLLMFLLKRDSVLDLLGKFRSEVCQPRDATEKGILSKYLRMARNAYYYRMIVSTMSCSVFFLVPIVKFQQVSLPIPTTYFEVNSSRRFIVAYLLQISAVYTTATSEVFLDSTVCAFVILASAQVDICRHRLVADDGFDENSFKYFVDHHTLIQSIIRKIQSTFMAIILPVFCFGLITLCTSLFKFTQISTILLDRVFCTLYLAYLLYPIYIYCWYGNKLQLMNESIADTIYEKNWTTLNSSERKNHWYVMFVSQKKMEISYHGQCILTLQTFLWMMKTSYGVFNLLQHVSLSE